MAVSIQKILNLNHDLHTTDELPQDQSARGLVSHSTPILNEDGDPIWKVLVFDGLGRDVISSVLRVNDLRAWGVTIHLYASALAISVFSDASQKPQLYSLSDPRCPRCIPR